MLAFTFIHMPQHKRPFDMTRCICVYVLNKCVASAVATSVAVRGKSIHLLITLLKAYIYHKTVADSMQISSTNLLHCICMRMHTSTCNKLPTLCSYKSFASLAFGVAK
uniref:Uncharacterized protein n=1 Tax=Ceratitis capitata TaxID=7213 RepID=W8BRS2_CERCA